MRQLKRNLWPVKICIKDAEENALTKMEIWMGEKFGAFKGRWNIVQHHGGVDFYFRNEQDAVMFSLKWAK